MPADAKYVRISAGFRAAMGAATNTATHIRILAEDYDNTPEPVEVYRCTEPSCGLFWLADDVYEDEQGKWCNLGGCPGAVKRWHAIPAPPDEMHSDQH